MLTQRYLPVAAFFITVLVFSACSTQRPESPPIVIGATMSQTGAYNTQGIAAKNGYLLCQDHINNQGGVLGRNIEFLIYDDESDTDSVVELYERLITEDQVDLIMGPYGSTLTEAVVPVTERYGMVHITPLAAASSIWEQGVEYLFMILPPAELFLAGLIEMAEGHGLSRVAILQQDALFPMAAGGGAADLAREKGMDVVFHETYTTGTEDFSDILDMIRDGDVEALGMAASPLDDFIRFTEQMKEHNVNVQMFGTSGAVAQYQQALGSDAEYTYGLSAWEPKLTHPGIDEFTEAYEAAFNIAPSFHAAGAYGSCKIFAEAIEITGSMDSDELRNTLLNLETQTMFGEYAVDEQGYQTAHKGLFIQWQDGEKQIVWPDDVATAAPRFPAPDWDER